MQLSTDGTEILVNGKSKYSARSISFVLGTDVCVLCIASAATGSVSSQCVECGNVPIATVRTGFRLNEHRLDGKMRKPRPREVTTIEQDDFDNEAKLLFESLGLDASGQGHVHHDKYCSINQIYSGGEGKGTIFVGNKNAASTRAMLKKDSITHIVNCTKLLPNYFEAEAGMSYLRFEINLWMQRVNGTPESILHFLKPFFDFVDRAVDSGRSVLVHCVAGAHRAGTAGCLLLMHYHQLAAKDATTCMRSLRPVTEPKGALLQLLERYEQAVGVV
jgi:hypothetical protein